MRYSRIIAIVASIVLAGSVLGCELDDAASVDESQQTGESATSTASVVLDIDGMTCVSCAATIEGEFDDSDEIVDGSIDFGEEKAVVDYNPDGIDETGIIELIENAGFDADVAGES